MIVVKDGRARFVYDDRVHAALAKFGDVHIRRASSVEYDHARGGWMADMSPSLPGLVLGPFASRTEALAQERHVLEIKLADLPLIDEPFKLDVNVRTRYTAAHEEEAVCSQSRSHNQDYQKY